MTENSPYIQVYHFDGISIPDSTLLREQLEARFSTLKPNANDRATKAVITEIEQMIVDIDRHISSEARKNLQKAQ